MDGLLVGRFQPFHLGHLEALRFALGRCSRLWLGIGSSNAPPGPSNPFSAAERREMVSSSAPPGMLARIRMYDVPDYNDHAEWAANLDATVPPYGVVFTNDGATAALYEGRPARPVRVPLADRGRLEGARVRAALLAGSGWEGLVPDGTRRVLERIGARARLARL